MKYWRRVRSCSYIKQVAVAVGVLLASQSGFAGTANDPFGLRGGSVTDPELAQIRGRFVDGRSVTYFGVVMQTQWTQLGGHNYNMEMGLNIDLEDRFNPVVTLYFTDDLGAPDGGGDPGPLPNVRDNGAFENISGVVQGIQVAGDGNAVWQDVEWNISDQPFPMNGSGTVINSSVTERYIDADGVRTHVSVTPDGIGYKVNLEDMGAITQRIGKVQITRGSLLQSTQLNSNYHDVVNRMGLNIEMSPASSLSGSVRHFNKCLDNLRGL